MSSLDLLLTLGLDLAGITQSLLEKKRLSHEEQEKIAIISGQYTDVKHIYSIVMEILQRYYQAIDASMATYGDFSRLNKICSQDYRHKIEGLIKALLGNSYHSRIIDSFQLLTLTAKKIDTTNEGVPLTYWMIDALVLENWNLFKVDQSIEGCELIVKYDLQFHGGDWLVYGCNYFTEVQMSSPMKKFLPLI